MHDTYEKKNRPEEKEAGAFVSFFVQYCLRHLFKSKREMSKELGIGYQTILLVTNTPERYKGASLVFQELVIYCVRKDVSLDEIVLAFYREDGAKSPGINLVLQAPDYYACCPLLEEYEPLLTPEKEDSLLAKSYLFIFRMHEVCCKSSMCFWNQIKPKKCLIHQTMIFLVARFQE